MISEVGRGRGRFCCRAAANLGLCTSHIRDAGLQRSIDTTCFHVRVSRATTRHTPIRHTKPIFFYLVFPISHALQCSTMPRLNAHVRQGAYLPHWTKEGATYHVRFRLADSMPQHILKKWQEEKKELLHKAGQKKIELTQSEQERLRELSSEKVEWYLQQGYGACVLKQDRVAEIVANALRKNNEKHYRLSAWCIMPNHMHVILMPLDQELHQIVNTWKSTSARKANRFLKREGALWQVEYFDHLIRNEEGFCHAINYVWNNPTEAGLKDWKWRWKAEGL